MSVENIPEDLQLSIVILADKLGSQLRDLGWRVTTAESCTGGLIAAAITDIAGSSAWFQRGLVTYSNSVKSELLGVSDRVLSEYGAVSEACVTAMAKGALDRGDAELAIAVSGVAGPGGGSKDKPVGLVWMAWALAGVVETQCFEYSGGRQAVRLQAVVSTLHGSIERLQRIRSDQQ